ncbi:MAG: Rne/Rng family ribonuclease, partial [Candidatus Eisenbacteria bacterium]|nr:Rne/Rng family ribonuclease [Candidatus Eisenbacteria bacterium]
MQAAFVDIGLARTAFLHVSDMLHSMIDFGAFDIEETGGDQRRGHRHAEIQDVLEKGQEILVQIVKEAIGTKGPKVSGHISLPGRYLVLMPGMDHTGVSRKVENREERFRLKKILRELKPRNAGIICRTAAEGKGAREFEQDVKFLMGMWHDIEEKAGDLPSPALVHQEMTLVTGLIRDLFSEEVDRVVIDSKEIYRQILNYLKSFAPELKGRIKLYKGEGPIFDEYGIEAEIERALQHKVWLKKGGYIVIDHTEALVSIDVNTGRFIGKKNQEETILKTNLEAAREIARQLRLRDMGGIVIVDFIDMEQEASKRQVYDAFRQALSNDRARTKVYPISDLGIVEMTRQRERPSLYHYFTQDCPTCEGAGKILSLSSSAMKLERYLRRVKARTNEKQVQVRVHPVLAGYLLDEQADRVADLERDWRLRLDIREDPRLRRDDIRIFFPRVQKDVTEEFQPGRR